MDLKTLTEHFKDLVTFISKLKVATLLFIMILLAIFFGFKVGVLQDLKNTNVTIDFAPLSKHEKKVEPDSYNNKTTLSIEDVRVTPAKFSIPSYLYFKVKNDGIHDANSVYVDIDLGTASVVSKDVRQSGCDFAASKSESLIELKCDTIRKDETIDVYLLISSPNFDSIVANGNNVYSAAKYTSSDISYESGLEREGPLQGFIVFLYFLVGGILIVITLTAMTIIGGWLFPHNEEKK